MSAELRRAGITILLVMALLGSGVLPDSECAGQAAPVLLEAHFDSHAEGFVFYADPFATSQPEYASGSWEPDAGYSGGGLRVTVGGVDDQAILGMSGGWAYVLNLASDAAGVAVSLRYRMTMPTYYEYDEFSKVMVSVDGLLRGRGSKAYVDHMGGDGELTGPETQDTEWQQCRLYIGALAAGSHSLVIGAYNNHKDTPWKTTTVTFDDVVVSSGHAAPVTGDAQTLVNRLSLTEFKGDIQQIAAFGDRCRFFSCEPYTSFYEARAWLQDELQAMGYATELRGYTHHGYSGANLWATKVGMVHPESMYMVTAHLDAMPYGRGADDNGSGVALVLSAARAFAAMDVTTDYSVRFIFWDQEEMGPIGSSAYVGERLSLQGMENPAGSGLYPEPHWLGNLTHDTLLYDHGVGTPEEAQSAYADLDVEWRNDTVYVAQSMELALVWRFLAGTYSVDYPANAYDLSTATDDLSFHDHCPAVSIRENRRSVIAEWINPFYHQTSDVFSSYVEDDFRLGFNAVQATVGAIAELAGARVTSINHPPIADPQSVITAKNNARAVTLSGSDPDGDPLIFQVVEYPVHGTLSGTAPLLTYTPAIDYVGSDGLAFKAHDGELDSDLVRVTIAVREPGVASLGDVNADGLANSTDALIVLSADVGVNTAAFCPMNCGDVNGNGLVDSTDALIILSYDAEMAVPFAIGQAECPVDVRQPIGCGEPSAPARSMNRYAFLPVE